MKLEVKDGVVHLRFATQSEMCNAMARVAEYYEGDDRWRGKRFNLERDFVPWYAAKHGGVYTYESDWFGYNIPGHIVLEYLNVFAEDLRYYDRIIAQSIKGLGRFYVIATFRDEEFTHELAHAMWYLDDRYRFIARQHVEHLRKEVPEFVRRLELWLFTRGYSPTVYDDEINAYMSTTPHAYWVEKIDEAFADKAAVIEGPFVWWYNFTHTRPQYDTTAGVS